MPSLVYKPTFLHTMLSSLVGELIVGFLKSLFLSSSFKACLTLRCFCQSPFCLSFKFQCLHGASSSTCTWLDLLFITNPRIILVNIKKQLYGIVYFTVTCSSKGKKGIWSPGAVPRPRYFRHVGPEEAVWDIETSLPSEVWISHTSWLWCSTPAAAGGTLPLSTPLLPPSLGRFDLRHFFIIVSEIIFSLLSMCQSRILLAPSQTNLINTCYKNALVPRLVWLSGLSAGL